MRYWEFLIKIRSFSYRIVRARYEKDFLKRSLTKIFSTFSNDNHSWCHSILVSTSLSFFIASYVHNHYTSFYFDIKLFLWYNHESNFLRSIVISVFYKIHIQNIYLHINMKWLTIFSMRVVLLIMKIAI